jgi:hypothetical protein
MDRHSIPCVSVAIHGQSINQQKELSIQCFVDTIESEFETRTVQIGVFSRAPGHLNKSETETAAEAQRERGEG